MNNESMKFMRVSEVAEVMGISKSMAYEYMQGEDCPFAVLRIKSRYVIPYNSFHTWYESLADNSKERRK